MKKILLSLCCLFLLIISAGCVRRIVTIDSQPQGAQIYFDRKLVGQTPHTHEFLYYGSHHLELVKEEYANLNTTVRLRPPLYEYFPLSVFSELLLPWQITDQHQVNFELQQGQTKKPVITPIEEPQVPLTAPRLERIEGKP